MIILLVEDEPILALNLEMDLSDAGYLVRGPVASHQAAIDLAETCPIDLALVNIDLKHGGSGIALAGELLKRWKIPSVFVSGQRDDAFGNQSVALGYISKPYDSRVVVACVKFVEIMLAGNPDRSGMPKELELFDRNDPAQSLKTLSR
jgi:two-component system, response regulator PdtaR